MKFHRDILKLDAAAEAERLMHWLRESVRGRLHRRGAVVGISGGVDSATVLALCVRAFTARGVVAVMMPERDSSPDSERLARDLAAQFGVEPVREDLTAALEGLGCYARRDAAIRRVFPEYDARAGWRAKIVLPPNLLDEDTLNVFSVTVLRPDGAAETRPLPTAEFLQIVAASNFKQRARMAMLYYHAEVRHFAVIGTANKNERDQGFFVKHGDAGVDCDPLAHLYKTQIYQLAEHLAVPEAIRRRTPTSDTYSAPCSQEEFFFRLPFATMDLLWFAQEHGVSIAETARVMDLTEAQVERAFADFRRKHQTTEPLRLAPLRADPPPTAP
jgi:NAD+ synthase